MQQLTHAAFAASVNSAFRVHLTTGKTVEIRLTNVSDQRLSERQEQFSILLNGPPDTFVPQGLYKLEHDAMGMLDLFIVPIGKDEHGYVYEAVFNRLRQST